MGKPATKFIPGSGISGMAASPEKADNSTSDAEIEQLRRITANIGDLVVELDTQGRIGYVSPSVHDMLGYDPAVLSGHSIFPYLHPEDAAGLRLPRSPGFFPDCGRLDLRVRHHDGQWVVLETEARLVRAPDRSVTGVIVVGRDVTNRVNKEQALRLSERRYRDLVDNSEDFVFSLDLGSRVTAANRSVCRLLATTEDEVIGASLDTLPAPHEFTRLVARLQRKVIKEGHTVETEARVSNGQGETKVFRLTVNPIRDELGGITGVAGLCRDITSQVQAIENIRYLTFHDKLTGLYNRAYFEEEITRHDSPRSLPLAIIIGDMNGLKLANDVLGHAEGDRLLTNTAKTIRSVLRREDVICRWGGDEFAIILPHTRAETAARVRDRVSDAIRTAAADPIPLSIALGLAVKSDPAQDIESVIREAETRMYRNKLLESRNAHGAIVSFLQESLSQRTHEDRAHAARLESLMCALGRALDLNEKQLARVPELASLHDIGKIGVAREILERAGPLCSEEWEAVKRHSEIGYRIAVACPDLASIAEHILAHHERWDGTGYPQGLAGTEIPLMARILAVADAFDVMTHGRPYRPAVSQAEAIEELERQAGSQFDPAIIQAFVGILRG